MPTIVLAAQVVAECFPVPGRTDMTPEEAVQDLVLLILRVLIECSDTPEELAAYKVAHAARCATLRVEQAAVFAGGQEPDFRFDHLAPEKAAATSSSER